MRMTILACSALALIGARAVADERAVQECVCAGMQLEVDLPSGARADCVSEMHAIEVDPTHHWAEAIGQSLHYAEQLDLDAQIFLFCAWGVSEAQCYRHQLRLESTIAAHSLPIEVRYFTESEVSKVVCPPERATE